jgi:hypothetical protein
MTTFDSLTIIDASLTRQHDLDVVEHRTTRTGVPHLKQSRVEIIWGHIAHSFNAIG